VRSKKEEGKRELRIEESAKPREEETGNRETNQETRKTGKETR
jgi:hypothetical protein